MRFLGRNRHYGPERKVRASSVRTLLFYGQFWRFLIRFTLKIAISDRQSG